MLLTDILTVLNYNGHFGVKLCIIKKSGMKYHAGFLSEK